MATYKQYLNGVEEALDIDHISRPGNDTLKLLTAEAYACPRGCIITKVKAVGNADVDATVSLWSLGADTSAAADIAVELGLEDADEITGPFSKVEFVTLKGLIWIRTGA